MSLQDERAVRARWSATLPERRPAVAEVARTVWCRNRRCDHYRERVFIVGPRGERYTCRWCGWKLHVRSGHVPEDLCVGCGEPFTSERPQAIYCSATCRRDRHTGGGT